MRSRLMQGDAMPENTSQALESPHLVSATSIAELSRRPSRPPDYAAENGALVELAKTLATNPRRILQRLSDTALALCGADSAGLSLLEDEDEQQNFHWRAISGEWAPHRGGGTPRDFGPCGTVLDRNMPLLFSHPERDFPYFGEVMPLLEDALLIPFYIDGAARGTIWVVSHDPDRQFDAEDLRVMTVLGNFTSLAYRTVLSLEATKRSEQILTQADVAISRFEAIFQSCEDAIVSKTLGGIIDGWNAGAERLFGYTAAEAIGKPITMLIPPDRLAEEPEILSRIRRGERIQHFDTKRVRKDGGVIDISLTISPIRNGTGRVIGASKIARDITERKNIEMRQELLVGEMKHRIKNTLATVQAIATQTLCGTSAKERNGFIARLHSLANAHDVLTKENWDRASLLDLVNRTLEPFQGEKKNAICVGGPPAWLDAEKATMVTMALHELATNAVKYGALSVVSGRVNFTWNHRDPGCVEMVWEEKGGPAVVAPTRRGFGSRLIENIFKSEPGDPQLRFLPKGLVCAMNVRCIEGPQPAGKLF